MLHAGRSAIADHFRRAAVEGNMTWIADLEPCGYFGPDHVGGLLAVGWLERDHPFTRGDVAEDAYHRLVALSQEPWSPIASSGWHECSLCRYSAEATGNDNLFIPGDGVVYICPELIVHYMNAHGYAPPPAFCEAVLACPDMKTMEYRKALLANGAGSLVRSLR